ncbi:MAG TPA: S9 family peptidase, partial [Pyrinomonadaceae bacterium]
WMSSDGANIKPLTDDQKVRHNFGEWSKDGKKIYYASNKRDRNWFDIYSMQIETGAAELLYQQDGSNSVAAVSDDGGKIIVSRSSVRFSLDNDLYLIDTKTKKQTHLTPHDEATQYGDVSFLPDGKTILLGTNFGHEYINLAQMNLKTGESGVKQGEIQFLDSENWELDASEVSGDGSLLAYTVNREGYSELYFRPLATGGDPHGKKSAAVKLPARGVVNNLVFSKDKTRLAFTFSASKYNTDIWLYDLKSKKLSQITKSDRAGIAQESFVEPQLIKFKSFDGREIPAWYYKPQAFQKHIEAEAAKFEKARKKRKNAQTKQQPAVWREEDITRLSSPSLYPVIVSVHGGPEGQERPGFNPLYQYYLSRGYAVLATNVRGSTGYGKTFSHLDDVEKREDSVKDLAYAVQWLKTAGGADAKRIAVMGGSYGGYMTMAAITLYPELWAAAVNTVGIVNWETFLKNTSGYRRRQREVEYGMLDKDIEFLRRISPIAKVDKIKTPLFVIHGRNDPRVPYTEAEQIVKVLKDRGATVEYKLFDDEGHGISKLKNRLELYPLVADFLDKYMK